MIASLFENFFRIELGMKNEDTISKLAKQRASELSYMTPLDAVIQLRKKIIEEFTWEDGAEDKHTADLIVKKMTELKIESTKKYE